MLLISQITLLAIWSSTNTPRTTITILTIALNTILTLILAVASYLEHVRSIRPSTVLILYFGISTLFDAVRIRTVFRLTSSLEVPGILIGSLCFKILILLLESYEKQSLIISREHQYPRETTAGIINRSLFLWLNPLFIQGYTKWLTTETLMPIDSDILSASQPVSLIDKWNNGKQHDYNVNLAKTRTVAQQSKENVLLWMFFLFYKRDILKGVLPRLALIGFSFAQPFLIDRVLDFINQAPQDRDSNVAYGLIGAYFIVYLGIAVCWCVENSLICYLPRNRYHRRHTNMQHIVSLQNSVEV